MDKLKQNEDEPKIVKNHSKLFAILFGVAALCAVGLGIALWWCLWGHSTPPASGSAPATSGPCTAGAPNTLPDGFSWYENADLGYKFAYPTAWGAVTVATTPMGGTAGHYALGSFAANDDVTFGGNATDYIVNARGGTPTDNPGFLEAHSKFYAVQIWKLHDPSGTDEPHYALYPLEDSTVAKNACNTKAVVTQYPETEFYGYSYDVARFNLQPSNLYYGVNVVLKNPTAASRADLDKIIASFQLIP